MRGFGRSKRPDAAGRVRRALLAVLDAQRDRAVDELREVVRADSDDFLCYLALAHLYRERGEIGRALRIHQNLLMRSEMSARLRLRTQAALAEDLRAGGHRDRAIAAYQEVLAHDPDDEVAKSGVVELLLEAGAPERALPYVERRGVLRRGGDAVREAELLRAMARAERAQGRDGAARKLLRRALKRDPGAVDAHIALGDLEAERGKDKAALAIWRQAIPLVRDDPDALWQRIGSACAALEQPGEIEKLARTRLEQEPEDSAARRALARLLAGRGEVDAALGELHRTLDAAPGDLRSRVQLGRLLIDEKRETDAAQELGELLAVLADSRLATVPMPGSCGAVSGSDSRRDPGERTGAANARAAGAGRALPQSSRSDTGAGAEAGSREDGA